MLVVRPVHEIILTDIGCARKCVTRMSGRCKYSRRFHYINTLMVLIGIGPVYVPYDLIFLDVPYKYAMTRQIFVPVFLLTVLDKEIFLVIRFDRKPITLSGIHIWCHFYH